MLSNTTTPEFQNVTGSFRKAELSIIRKEVLRDTTFNHKPQSSMKRTQKARSPETNGHIATRMSKDYFQNAHWIHKDCTSNLKSICLFSIVVAKNSNLQFCQISCQYRQALTVHDETLCQLISRWVLVKEILCISQLTRHRRKMCC